MMDDVEIKSGRIGLRSLQFQENVIDNSILLYNLKIHDFFSERS